MTSPAEPHVTEKTKDDVHVIDIEDDVDNIIDTLIEKSDDEAIMKIKDDEISTDTVTLQNENDIVFHSKPVPMFEVVQKVRGAYNRGITRPIEWRRRQLKNLLRMFEEHGNAMCDVIYKDLKRCKFESRIPELDLFINDIKDIIHNFEDWCKPEKPDKDIANLLDDVLIYKEPLGVALIIATWNYPILLLLMPACGAIAAGNAVVLKPSEIAINSNKFLVELLPKYVDSEAIVIVEAGPEETVELLKQKFDYIFYTGSTSVGKTIYEAASKHLTPVTLELGGKSPVFIDNSANIAMTSKRLLFGKFVNAGQTCIAPDYVLCVNEAQNQLIEECKKTLWEWYGNNPQNSPDYARIINDKHFSRLQALVDASKDKIVCGGRYDPSDRYIEPTIVGNATSNDKVMQVEIFGPILPIVPVENVDEAIKFINDREKPLVLYVFTNKESVKKKFIETTSSGQMCINDTVSFVAVKKFPFGGVGGSGMGSYHGKFSVETFMRKKACLKKNFFIGGEKLISIRYPPYKEYKYKFLKLVLMNRNLPSMKFMYYLLAFAFGAILSYAMCIYMGKDDN